MDFRYRQLNLVRITSCLLVSCLNLGHYRYTPIWSICFTFVLVMILLNHVMTLYDLVFLSVVILRVKIKGLCLRLRNSIIMLT